MKVRKPLLRRRLFISDRSYYLGRSQAEGEKDLARIAEGARREDAWIFYKDSGLWLHLPNDHFEQVSQERGLVMECDCPAVYESPLGKEAIHYHIHPNLCVTNAMAQFGDTMHDYSEDLVRDVLFAWFSMPSEEDLKTITGKGKGYEHKIITTRGVTSMRCNPNETFVQVNNPEQFFRDCIDPATIGKKGFEAGIEDALCKANKEYGGYLHSTYEPRFH